MSGPRGRFITLEGGEGAGKTTLAKSIGAALTARGVDVVLTREPGGAPGADDIRTLLVTGDPGRWTPLAELLLLMAARQEHLHHTIRPALARGAWVICDRYLDSSRAYQTGPEVDQLARLIDADTPDLTLILDIDPAVGLIRSQGARSGEDRFERKGLAEHQRIRRAFLEIAAADPRRCMVIDATQPPELVTAAALAAIDARR